MLGKSGLQIEEYNGTVSAREGDPLGLVVDVDTLESILLPLRKPLCKGEMTLFNGGFDGNPERARHESVVSVDKR